MEAQERSTTPPKAKRQLTEAQLAQLAKAREKANAVRKQNAQQKQERKKKNLAAEWSPLSPPPAVELTLRPFTTR